MSLSIRHNSGRSLVSAVQQPRRPRRVYKRVCRVALASRGLHVPAQSLNSFSPLESTQPVYIPRCALQPLDEEIKETAASRLLRALRTGEHRTVDIEVGRFDDPRPGGFEHVSMPLKHYLDWLERLGDPQAGETAEGVSGPQVYLAQWRARDEIEAVARLTKPPPPLQTLLTDRRADLYQSALFLGPTGAVTPLHFDPYMNLYHLQASSDISTHAKHFNLLPPSASRYLSHSHGGGGGPFRNVSRVQFRLQRRILHDHDNIHAGFDVCVDPTSVSRDVVEAIERETISCVLREGDTLFIPRGWWHRVENVALDGSPRRPGWTAGLSWWFLPRNNRDVNL